MIATRIDTVLRQHDIREDRTRKRLTSFERQSRGIMGASHKIGARWVVECILQSNRR